MRKVFFSVGVLLVGLGLAWYVAGHGRLRRDDGRALSDAQSALRQGDLRRASFLVREQLQRHPEDLGALRLMAEVADRGRSPQTLDWWRSIVELAPSEDNKLSYGAVSLRYEGPPFAIAESVLKELASLPSAAYQTLAGTRALRLGRIVEAEFHFDEAFRQSPGNPTNQFNLAAIRLGSTNTELAAEARNRLEELQAAPGVGKSASKCLMLRALQDLDATKALGYSRAILAGSDVGMEDRLQHLSLLSALKDNTLPTHFEAVQRCAGTNGNDIYVVGLWMIQHGNVTQAINWLGSFPEFVVEQQPVPMAFVEAYVASKDWVALEKYLQEGHWGEMEYLRLAFLARAILEQGHRAAGEVAWRGAMAVAGNRFGPMLALVRMAQSLGRAEDYEALLWRVGREFPRERWVFAELDRFYTAEGNSRGLYKLYSTLLRLEPGNPVLQNNTAALGLLLGRDLASSHRLAAQVHASSPTNLGYASTYAFSLCVQGRTVEAAELARKHAAEALGAGHPALYFAMVLSAADENAAALDLWKAAEGVELLPEERELLRSKRPVAAVMGAGGGG